MANLQDAAFRRSLWERDAGLCGFCGQPVPVEAMHVDHIRPRAVGGADEPENLRPSHPRCNLSAGAKGLGRPSGQRPRNEECIDTHVYLPLPIHQRIIERAQQNRRSLNAEIVLCLEQCLGLTQHPAS